MENIKPLNININKAAINGNIYDVYSYDEFTNQKNIFDKTAVLVDYKDQKILLPYRGDKRDQVTPGIYNAGCIDFCIYPADEQLNDYIPEKIININNNDDIKEVYKNQKDINKLMEPWISNPDNVTKFPIHPDDQPEMVGLKSAWNAKEANFDDYGSLFGDNFPNDKRQMKNHSATLNIIKRFAKNCDMEVEIIFRDKNPDVLNPMNTEIHAILTGE
jgi:hypothetical protein